MHAAKVDDLVIDDLDHVEGFVICHGVDQDEAVYANCMLGIKDGIFILQMEEGGRCERAVMDCGGARIRT